MMRVFLTGATGFVGGHLRRALVREGHQVVGFARHAPAEDDGVCWVEGDVSDGEALAAGMAGCEAVIHLVGIIRETQEATFQRMHVEGTEHVLAAMRRQGIDRLLQMSALGAGPKQTTGYFRTKWQAEELVRAAGIAYTIFRPSITFGPGDGFINQLVHQIKHYPIIPIIGSGNYPMAVISIHAVVAAYVEALRMNGPTQAKTFELCGPEVLSYLQIVRLLQQHLQVHKLRLHLPVGLLRLGITLGRFAGIPLPITHEQLAMLLQGSVCNEQEAQQVFALPRITLREGIDEYL